MTTDLHISCPHCGHECEEADYLEREALVREGLRQMARADERLGISRSPCRDVTLVCKLCTKAWRMHGLHL